MRELEVAALLSRWRDRTVETVVLCAGLALCALSLRAAGQGLVVLCVALALASAAGVPLIPYLRKLGAAAGFALVPLLPLSVAVATAPRWSLSFDPAGFGSGVLAGSRAVATLSVTLLLVHTTPFHRLRAFLAALRLPAALLDLLALVHREIFLLDESLARLRRALASRDGGRRSPDRFRHLALSTSALFAGSLRRARRRERGLASRGGVGGEALWAEPLRVRPLALAGAVALPTGLALWIAGGPFGS